MEDSDKIIKPKGCYERYYERNKERISIMRALKKYKKKGTIPEPNSRVGYFCRLYGLNIQEVLDKGIPKLSELEGGA